MDPRKYGPWALVAGQTECARHYGQAMMQRGRGGIILTGSLGGYVGSATLAAYSASKAFSRVFTEALWPECKPMGIDVLHLNIGFTDNRADVVRGNAIAPREQTAEASERRRKLVEDPD